MKAITKHVVAITGAVLLLAIAAYAFIYTFQKVGGPGLADYSVKIADICTLSRSSAYAVSITCDGIKKSIDPDVFQLGWNQSYLTAETHPVDKPDPNNANCVNCFPDETVTYWWIVDLKSRTLYGPMYTEAEFNNRKIQLKVGKLQMSRIDEAITKGSKIE